MGRVRRVGGPARAGLIVLLAFVPPHPPSSSHSPYWLAAQDSGGERARAEALSRRVNDRVRALRLEADRLAGQTRTLLGDLRKLEIERDLQAEHAAQAEADRKAAEEASRRTAATLDALEQQRVAQLPDLSAQLVEVYKQRRGGHVRMLLGVRDLREFGRATRAMAALTHLNQQRIAAHRRTIEALHQERAELDVKTREHQALLASAQQARAAAARAVADRARLIEQIDRRRDLNAQLLGELQVAQQELEVAVTALRAGRAVEPVTISIAAFRGTLDWPVVGRVVSRFGRSASTGGVARNGIEIAAPEGTPVAVVHAGTVRFADAFTGYGILVIVDHGNGHFSLYAHLSTATVETDKRVDAGDAIGRVGSGPAGPPGLYFEMRIDDRSVDPLQWLKPR